MRAALEMAIGGGGVIEAEFPIDDGFQAVRRDRRIHAFEMPARSDVYALDARLFAQQSVRAAGGGCAGEDSDHRDLAADRHGTDGTAQRSGAADVQNMVDSLPAGQLEHFALPLRGGAIVDAPGGAEAAGALEFSVARRGDDDPCAGEK